MDQTPQPNGMSKGKAWTIGIVIILLIVAGFWMYNRSQTVTDTTAPTTTEYQNALTIRDQDPDAVAVLIEYASVNTPSFIVIHDDNNGQPGAIVGTSALLQPGVYHNLSVIMPMKAGATYYGMFHADDGNGLFDHMVDSAHLTDAGGKEIIVTFHARLSSTPEDIKG